MAQDPSGETADGTDSITEDVENNRDDAPKGVVEQQTGSDSNGSLQKASKEPFQERTTRVEDSCLQTLFPIRG
jgi:hypothetical protein